jgi:predicted RNase H-like HicB family nuclease
MEYKESLHFRGSMKPAEFFISLPMPQSVSPYGDGYRIDVTHWPGCFSLGMTVEKAKANLRPAMAAYVRAALAKKAEPPLPCWGEYPDVDAAAIAFQAGLELGRRQGIAWSAKRLKDGKSLTPETAGHEEGTGDEPGE